MGVEVGGRWETTVSLKDFSPPREVEPEEGVRWGNTVSLKVFTTEELRGPLVGDFFVENIEGGVLERKRGGREEDGGGGGVT